MKKTFILVLSVILLLSCILTGCDNTQQTQNGGEQTFDATNYVLVENGFSPYSIVIKKDSDEAHRYPAEELQHFIKQSTGCELPIISDENLSFNEDSYYLSVGKTTIFNSLDIDVELADYGMSGVSIDTVNKSVFMTGADDVGTLYSVYRFLHYQIGFIAYADDCVEFDYYDKLNLLDFDYHYKPSIENVTSTAAQLRDNYYDNARMFLQGTVEGGSNIYYRLFSGFAHTMETIVPASAYKDLHSDWFKGEQLCYTSEGLAEQTAKNIFASYIFSKSPYLMLGGADTPGACTCTRCKGLASVYGGQAGLYVRFLNQVADYLESYLQENGIKKDLVIIGLMYHSYEAPPVKTVGGQMQAVHESVIPDSQGQIRVGVCYAPISACFTHSFDDPDCSVNRGYLNYLKGWAFLTDELYFYNYPINNGSDIFPYNNWSAYQSQYNLYKEYGVKYVFEEGFGGYYTPLSQARIYITARLGWEHTLNVWDLVDDFMNNYYGSGANAMKEYMDMIIEQYSLMYKIDKGDCQGTYYEIQREDAWQHEKLLNMSRIIKNGIFEVRKSKYTEQEKQVFEERLYREYLLCRVLEYKLYSDRLTADELKELEALVALADETLSSGGYKILG